MKKSIQLYVPFSKKNEEERMVYGYATTESIDSQGEVVSKDAIKEAWNDYMKFANVREMHQPSAVGVTKEYAHTDEGTWIGVKVVDDIAWNKVKEGVYKGFSIGGRILEKVENVIQGIILAEISLVDRPANPDAIFEIVKMDDSAMDALLNIKKEDINMNLATIFAKSATEWTDEEKAFVKEHQADLDDTQKDLAKDVLGEEAPAEETPAEDPAPEGDEPAEEAPAEDPKEDVPAEEPAAEDAPADKAVEVSDLLKRDHTQALKDANGVMSLAYLLESCEYMIQRFASDGKSTKMIEKARDAIMSAVSAEASEKGVPTGDLAKVMAESFKKVLDESGLAKAEDVAALSKRLEAVEQTPAKKAPASPAAIVEKGFEGEKTEKKATALKGELAEIQKKIDAFQLEAKDADASQAATLIAKSNDLFKEYREKQNEINEALAAGNY